MTTDHPGEEQRDGAGATPEEPAWYMATHYVEGTPGNKAEHPILTVRAEFFNELARFYAEDAYMTVGTNCGLPARRITLTILRPCMPHEIPEEHR